MAFQQPRMCFVLFVYSGLQKSMGIVPNNCSDEQVGQLKALYQELADLYPRSAAVRRMPLNFLKGPEFEERLLAYMQPKLRKGVPSLFRDLKSLYTGGFQRISLLTRAISIDFFSCLWLNRQR